MWPSCFVLLFLSCKSARSLMETGDYGRAVVCYTKSLTLRPRDVTCITERAECYLRLADFHSAILNYKKACLFLPGDVTYHQRLAFIYYLYGQCLFEQNQFTMALEAFERAKDLDRDNVWFQYRRSYYLFSFFIFNGFCNLYI